jgi:putative ABC transport system permease protein
MRSLWAAGLLLRRVRMERGALGMLFVLLAATTFVFSAAPRLFDRVADDGLAYALHSASPVQRDLTLAVTDIIAPGPDRGIAVLRSYGERREGEFPPAVEAEIVARSLRFSSVSLSVVDPPVGPTQLVLRYQDGIPDATRLVAGRWPVDRGMPLRPGREADDQSPPAIVEVAFSAAEAAEIGVVLGDQLGVAVNQADPVVAFRHAQMAPAIVEVVGLFEPLDPAADRWVGDADLLHAIPSGPPEAPTFNATAYVAAEAYPSLVGGLLPIRYEWHFQIDPALSADHVTGLRAGLLSLAAGGVTSADANPGSVEVRTTLPALLDRFIAQRSLTEAILSLAAIGPLALGGAAVGLVAVLLVARRRAGLALARGRGASGSLVLGTALWEAILVAGSATIVGFLGATLAIPGRADALSAWLALGVGAGAVILLVGTTWPTARRPLGRLERLDPPTLRVTPRRLVVELTIVGTAVATAFLLRQRGLTAVPAGEVARFDPLLTAVPVLGGLAAGIVVMRLSPLPIRVVGWLAARRRDLVPVLGLRTLGRLASESTLPLLVLMLAAAFGAFSSVLTSSIDRGQVVASALQVGADYRIDAAGFNRLPPTLDPMSASGVEAVADAVLDTRAPFQSFPTQHATLYLDAVDADAYADVTAGGGADPAWPRAFLAAPLGADPGSDANPIPAIISTRLPAGSVDLAVGATFHATVAARTASVRTMAFRVVERRPSFPGIGSPASFVVVPLGWIRTAFGDTFVPVNTIWVRGPAEVAEPLDAMLAGTGHSGHLVSRYEAYAKLHDAPLVAAVASGFGLALAVAAIYLALTFVGAMVLTARRRTQDLAYLRTLGISARQALALVAVEQAPTIVLAVVPGVALGVALAILLEPGLGLATFEGAAGIPPWVDWIGLAAIVAVLVTVVAGAVAVGTWLARRPGWTDALRIGDA